MIDRSAARVIATVLCLTAFAGNLTARGGDVPVRLNTVGYLPDRPKRASIAAPCSGFAVVRASDGTRVWAGNVFRSVRNDDTGEELVTADFSKLIEPGVYYLDVPGVGRSPEFRIAADIYNEPFRLVTRAMYLWRCGAAVRGLHGGDVFSHNACHLQDAWLDYVGGGHVKKSSSGGWHDAGDYNKYVVNAGVTVGCMLRAWEDFGPAIQTVRLDLPGSGAEIPQFLAEIKWELDWLLTMQADDGSVYHKLSTLRFGGMMLPERETAERYFSPWSSAATADFVAMTAAAARVYRRYDGAFADECGRAAAKSYAFLAAHPENHAADLRDFTTGPYQTRDEDDRLWAAAEYWNLTGDAAALRDIEVRLHSLQYRVDADFDWGNVNNLGVLCYLFSDRPGRDDAVIARVRQNLISVADGWGRSITGAATARSRGSRWSCSRRTGPRRSANTPMPPWTR